MKYYKNGFRFSINMNKSIQLIYQGKNIHLNKLLKLISAIFQRLQ